MPFTLMLIKRNKIRLGRAATVLALMLPATASTVGAQYTSHEDNDREVKSASIEGSWILNINGVGQRIQFNSLISFTAGGVVITSPSTGPATGPFYGIWKPKQSKRFSTAFYTFVLDPTGKAVGMGKLNLQLHLTGHNEVAGTGVGSACDLQGENCVAQADFEFTGKRIVLEDGE